MTNSGTLPFHTFLWKVASRCNINCTYCYVYNSVDQSWRDQPNLMSAETARTTAHRMVDHLQLHQKTSVSIIFHGGEPMMGGVKHFRMLVDIINEVFADTGIHVSLGMQTNLLLLTEQMADFLLEHNFSVGVSLDGPPKINDRYRVDKRGRPTSTRLEAALAILTQPKYRSIFGGFLCVIDPKTDPVEVTEYLLKFDPIGIDFLYPLDNHERLPPEKTALGDTAPYGSWLVKSYDYWLTRPNQTRIRIFQSIINMICGGESLVEALGLRPVDLIVIETDGKIEAVDSLKTTFEGAAFLGYNVRDDDFETVARNISVRARQLGIDSLASTCQTCEFVDICGGGYLPHRYSRSNGFNNPSIYCSDLQMLIGHLHQSVGGTLRPIIRRATRRAQANGFRSSTGMSHAHQPIIDLARQLLDSGDHQTFLDLGCGNGLLAHKIASHTGAIPLGMELDRGKASIARRLLQRSGGTAIAGNMYTDPWPDGPIDLCILPLGAFAHAPQDMIEELRTRMFASSKTVAAYAYDDDLARFGSLKAMTDRAGLQICGEPIDGVVSVVKPRSASQAIV